VWVQVMLSLEVWFIMLAHVVIKKHDWHNEWDEAFMIRLDNF